MKEFDELMWKYYLSDIKQKEYEEIERELYEDAKFQNEAIDSNFANFKPKSSPKRKNTD